MEDPNEPDKPIKLYQNENKLETCQFGQRLAFLIYMFRKGIHLVFVEYL